MRKQCALAPLLSNMLDSHALAVDPAIASHTRKAQKVVRGCLPVVDHSFSSTEVGSCVGSSQNSGVLAKYSLPVRSVEHTRDRNKHLLLKQQRAAAELTRDSVQIRESRLRYRFTSAGVDGWPTRRLSRERSVDLHKNLTRVIERVRCSYESCGMGHVRKV
jgi:hypothetical protein